MQREVAAGARPAELERIEARLAQITTTPGRQLVFSLDNGQVWRQLATSEDLLVKPGDTVTISKGWLGSFTLEVSSGRQCKVIRVR
jgi:hypothetical protein